MRRYHGRNTIVCTEDNAQLLYSVSNGEPAYANTYRREKLYITARKCFVRVILAGPKNNCHAHSIPLDEAETIEWIKKHIPDEDALVAIEHVKDMCTKIKGNYVMHRYMHDKIVSHSEKTGIKISNIIENALNMYFGYNRCGGLMANKELWEEKKP